MDPAILIFDSPAKAAAACGARTLELLREARGARGVATLAVSGGSTPRIMFEWMSKQAFDWDAIELFQVDERCVPPDHPQSNFRMLRESLLGPVSFDLTRVHRIDGELAPAEAARQYAAEILRVMGVEMPRFDVIQRGMGADAHTASLFPGGAIIEDRTGIAAAVHTDTVDKSMQERVTLRRGVLENARHTLCLATGADKAEALLKVLRAPFDPVALPAQIFSADTVWYIDRAAAAKL